MTTQRIKFIPTKFILPLLPSRKIGDPRSFFKGALHAVLSASYQTPKAIQKIAVFFFYSETCIKRTHSGNALVSA